MIVLAILVSIAALVIPNLRRNFQRNELRDAGRQLQEVLGELRQEALQTGRPLWVQFGWDSATLRVMRDGAWAAELQAAAANFPADLPSPIAGSGVEPSAWVATEIKLATDSRLSAHRWRLDTATRSQPQVPDEARSTTVNPNPPAFDSSATAGEFDADGRPADSAVTTWSRPVAVLPNGSVDEFHLWLHLDGRWQCPLLWRGATGQLEIGPIEVVTDPANRTSSQVQP